MSTSLLRVHLPLPTCETGMFADQADDSATSKLVLGLTWTPRVSIPLSGIGGNPDSDP